MIDTDEAHDIHVAEQRAPAAIADDLIQRAGASLRWGLSRLHRARRWLPRALIALIYAPTVALLLVGAAAAVGLLGDLWRLARAFSTHALDAVPTTYDRLALAGHVVMVSGAFLVLLCALVVVAVGCRGRRWWRLYLIPGVPLSAVAALLFIFAVQWGGMLAVNQRLGRPPVVWEILTALALADAAVVAARIGGIGAGPLGTRRARLRGRLRSGRMVDRISGRPASRQTRPIPVVRFGPRITGVPTPDLPAGTTTPVALVPDIADTPTAEELRAAAEPASVASKQQESEGAA